MALSLTQVWDFLLGDSLVEPQKVFLLFGRLIGLSLQACLPFAMFVALRGLRRKSEASSLRKH